MNIQKRLGLLSVFFFLVIFVIANILKVSFLSEPPFLLPILNTFFIGVSGIVAAFVCAQVYKSNRSIGVLLMGCGMLAFSLAASVSGWFRNFPNAANINVTIYNVGAVIGASFFFLGAVSFRIKRESFFRNALSNSSLIIFMYTIVFILIASLSIASVLGWLPLFFVQNVGPTLLRQIVIWAAIILYFLSFVFSLVIFLKYKSDYLFWLSISLVMFALGLFIVTLTPTLGSPLNWFGRISQYYGGLFSLFSALSLIFKAKKIGYNLNDTVNKFFLDSETNYKKLVETSTDAIISVNEQCILFSANKATEAMFGYKNREIIGTDIFGPIIPVELSDPIKEFIYSAEDTKTPSGSKNRFEIKALRKDGSSFHIDVSVSSRKLPTEWTHTFIIRDVSDQKRSEENLRKTTEYLENIIKSANAPIILWDKEFRVLRFNRAFENVTGLLEKDKIGQTIENIFPIDTREQTMDLLHKARRGDRWENLEIPIFDTTGTIHILLCNSAAIFSQEDNQIETIIVQGQDITKRKQALEDLMNLNQTLEQKVLDRTAQLQKSKDEIEGFAYSVSHDLRAPLRHISGFIELLSSSLPIPLEEKSQHYLTVISEAATEMGNLIDSLLSFSRMGRMEIKKTKVDPKKIIQSVIESFIKETDGRTIDWVIEDFPAINADGDLLKLLFSNLISNALKFTRRKEKALIKIGVFKNQVDENQITIYIKDNGVGFDMKYKDKLFGVFQRLHSKKDFEGEGIGLANVKNIVERHGGQVWAESEIDNGATFYFTFSKYKEGNV